MLADDQRRKDAAVRLVTNFPFPDQHKDQCHQEWLATKIKDLLHDFLRETMPPMKKPETSAFVQTRALGWSTDRADHLSNMIRTSPSCSKRRVLQPADHLQSRPAVVHRQDPR